MSCVSSLRCLVCAMSCVSSVRRLVCATSRLCDVSSVRRLVCAKSRLCDVLCLVCAISRVLCCPHPNILTPHWFELPPPHTVLAVRVVCILKLLRLLVVPFFWPVIQDLGFGIQARIHVCLGSLSCVLSCPTRHMTHG